MNRDIALDTYRYLRGGIPVMLVMLATALIIERAGATCWQTSISAYYFTSAHGVFVGSVCVVGALLIVYKGNKDTEDVLLNLAGIVGFVVAFVPTSRPVLLCGESGCGPRNQGDQNQRLHHPPVGAIHPSILTPLLRGSHHA